MNIYNDTTKGFLAFLLRIKQAHTDGLLGSHWGEASGRRADIINEWCVVAGENKMYPSTFELIQDIICKMGETTVAEIEAIGARIESKNINTKFKRFYSAEFLKESLVSADKKSEQEVYEPITFTVDDIECDKPVTKTKKKVSKVKKVK